MTLGLDEAKAVITAQSFKEAINASIDSNPGPATTRCVSGSAGGGWASSMPKDKFGYDAVFDVIDRFGKRAFSPPCHRNVAAAPTVELY